MKKILTIFAMLSGFVISMPAAHADTIDEILSEGVALVSQADECEEAADIATEEAESLQQALSTVGDTISDTQRAKIETAISALERSAARNRKCAAAARKKWGDLGRRLEALVKLGGMQISQSQRDQHQHEIEQAQQFLGEVSEKIEAVEAAGRTIEEVIASAYNVTK